MIFHELGLHGAWLIEIERLSDERGFFGRLFDDDDFAARGMATAFPQWSVSFNERRGTLRGMHYQARPGQEEKLVRCTMGRIHDVLLDLREESPTYCEWISFELSQSNRRTVYIPKGVAHGFLTLEDASEVTYHISTRYEPELQRGVRWDDPAFAIDWPEPWTLMSERDQNYEPFKP